MIQSQVAEVAHTQLKYRGMLHAIVTISKEESVKALYSGIAPALLRQASYGTIKLGCYHAFKRSLARDPQDETLLKNVISGVAAGALSSAIANPTDVLKVRMQVSGVNAANASQGMMASFANIYKLEGLRGLYRALFQQPREPLSSLAWNWLCMIGRREERLPPVYFKKITLILVLYVLLWLVLLEPWHQILLTLLRPV
ncbi:kidney mitochondrial carrier protein 1-like isoform X2 [Oscarella lobularis]